jgi:GNAT superfamily N-acetyltransferase
MPLTWVRATPGDAPLLAAMNKRLIEDEGHSNPMSVLELERRMRGWLGSGEYEAVLFGGAPPRAYALFRRDPDGVYLRQLYVERDCRRAGVGRAAVALLVGEVWPAGARVKLDVLVGNVAARAFWKAVGFREYAVMMDRSDG